MSRHSVHKHSTNAPAFPRGLVILGLLAGLGLTFVVGMNYGRKRTGHLGQSAIVEQKLSRLDRQEQELRQRRAQERARLSFHATLAGPARKTKISTDKGAQGKQSRPDAQHKNDSKTTADKSDVPVVTKAAMASPTADAAATKHAQNKNAADKSDAPLQAAQPQKSAAVAAPTEPAFDGDEQDDDDNRLATNDEASHFSLQVGAFPDASSAQNLVKRLSQKGYAVRIVSADVEGKGTWYRVRVGNFSAREKAEQKCSQLSDHEGLFALVVPEKG